MVIPVHDENPLRRTPWITYALIAANVVVLLLTPGTLPRAHVSAAATVCQQDAFYDRYGAIPHELITGRPRQLVPTGQPVSTPGGLRCAAGRPVYHKDPPLSVLEAMFIHAGWLHLLGNMLFLLIFGNNVEDRLRRLPYLAFYLACGYVAAYGYALVNQASLQPLVGASGAISGVLGAYLAFFPRARVWSLVPFLFFIPVRIPAWLVLGLWFVLQWAYAVGQPGGGTVAYVAHVFGFAAGLLAGLLLRPVTAGPRRA